MSFPIRDKHLNKIINMLSFNITNKWYDHINKSLFTYLYVLYMNLFKISKYFIKILIQILYWQSLCKDKFLKVIYLIEYFQLYYYWRQMLTVLYLLLPMSFLCICWVWTFLRCLVFVDNFFIIELFVILEVVLLFYVLVTFCSFTLPYAMFLSCICRYFIAIFTIHNSFLSPIWPELMDDLELHMWTLTQEVKWACFFVLF